MLGAGANRGNFIYSPLARALAKRIEAPHKGYRGFAGIKTQACLDLAVARQLRIRAFLSNFAPQIVEMGTDNAESIQSR